MARKRSWLRHPAADPPPPGPCPTGLPRFRNIGLAGAATPVGVSTPSYVPTLCDKCGGAHLMKPAGDNQ